MTRLHSELIAATTSAALALTLSARAAEFSFGPAVVSPLPMSHTPTAVRLGDFDGDGKLDAVVTGRNWLFKPGTTGRVSVLRGAAGGIFTPWHEILVIEGSTEDAAVRDFDGDGKLDVLLTLSGPRGRLAFARGHGDGTFDAPTYVDLERQPRGLCVGDLDGDGDVDAGAVNYVSSSLMVVRNQLPGGGNLVNASTQRLGQYIGGLPYPLQTNASDLNGDGKRDLLVTMLGGGRVSVMRGLGGGTFARSVDWKPANIAGEAPAIIGTSVADYDGDGDVDVALPVLLVTQAQRLILMRNDGSGGFAEQSSFESAGFYYSWCSAPIDVDGDGKMDVAIGTALSGSVTFMRNLTAGPAAPLNFALQPAIVFYGLFVRDLVAADIDGDGDQDLVGIEIAGSTVFTTFNTTPQGGVAGETVQRPPPRTVKRGHPANPVTIDLTGDGAVDARDVAQSLEQLTIPLKGATR
ncbi:MAG: VCBS repeat-containing protein [Phycisphaerae bacterium]|nr:VCBS repeat-containing protein [Phycisphaerae bacterium]